MSNKKIITNSLLIVGMVAVWGWIGLQFMTDPDQVYSSIEQGVSSAIEPRKVEVKLPALSLNYNDPFLKDTGPRKQDVELPLALNGPVVSEENKNIEWPIVSYFGAISNKGNSAKRLGLLSIDNKSYLVEKNKEIGDMIVSDFNSDSLILTMHQSKKVFYTH